MDYKVVNAGDCTTVFLEGRLAFGAYPDFRSATQPILADPSVSKIHLDLAAVDYLDSSALGMILHFKQKADDAHKGLALTRPNAHVASVLKVVNFSRLLTVLP